jgi:hypothetical protein
MASILHRKVRSPYWKARGCKKIGKGTHKKGAKR